VTDKAAHRALAAQFFNECWGLLDRKDRLPQDNLQMIHLAHASRLHWQFAGGAREWAIGEWQISRVHALLGQAEAALFHAQAALDLAGNGQCGPFLAASGHEGMARALRVAGRSGEVEGHLRAAATWLNQIEDAEDRAVVAADLAEAGQVLPAG